MIGRFAKTGLLAGSMKERKELQYWDCLAWTAQCRPITRRSSEEAARLSTERPHDADVDSCFFDSGKDAHGRPSAFGQEPSVRICIAGPSNGLVCTDYTLTCQWHFSRQRPTNDTRKKRKALQKNEASFLLSDAGFHQRHYKKHREKP
eukprot:scaffold374_cov271-Pinguiococcus_pyrenoidosus.AAC.5